VRLGFIRKGLRYGGERGEGTWHRLSGPKLAWPILQDCPLNGARLTTCKAGRSAKRHIWTLRQETPNARSTPKGLFAAAEKHGPLPARVVLPASKESVTRCPLPSPQRWKGCLPAGRPWGVGFRQGLRLPETTEMTLRWESWVAFPGLGHPLL